MISVKSHKAIRSIRTRDWMFWSNKQTIVPENLLNTEYTKPPWWLWRRWAQFASQHQPVAPHGKLQTWCPTWWFIPISILISKWVKKTVTSGHCPYLAWLVVEPPLWKIWKSVGILIPKYGSMLQTSNQCFNSILLFHVGRCPLGYHCPCKKKEWHSLRGVHAENLAKKSGDDFMVEFYLNGVK